MLTTCPKIDPCVVSFSASFHSTQRHVIFLNYVVGDFKHMYMVDDGYLDIIRKGVVNLVTLKNIVWTLKGVKHMLRLKRNLISMVQLDNEGYVTHLDEGR